MTWLFSLQNPLYGERKLIKPIAHMNIIHIRNDLADKIIFSYAQDNITSTQEKKIYFGTSGAL